MKLMTILASCAVSFMVMGTAVAAEKACPPEATKPEIGNLKEALRNSHNRGFLWKITKNGHASWLYGTIHVAQQSWLVPGPDVLRAVAQSQVVGLELDLSDPVTVRILSAADKPETAAWLAKTGHQKAVAEIAQPLCLSLAALGNVPLVTQAETLSSNVGRGLGYYPEYAIDPFLQD
ncbi:TraB/GumN family protein [Acetobacter orientalis]|nr:TraB/GumN family protein [Acetobacter orientalis]MCP1221442.1 TraB/GumN family protein [Acetobacter orientalis]